MANNNVILNIPSSDMAMITMLAEKMGWTMQNGDSVMKQFVASRPTDIPISEEEIMEEVRAVRYKV